MILHNHFTHLRNLLNANCFCTILHSSLICRNNLSYHTKMICFDQWNGHARSHTTNRMWREIPTDNRCLRANVTAFRDWETFPSMRALPYELSSFSIGGRDWSNQTQRNSLWVKELKSEGFSTETFCLLRNKMKWMLLWFFCKEAITKKINDWKEWMSSETTEKIREITFNQVNKHVNESALNLRRKVIRDADCVWMF